MQFVGATGVETFTVDSLPANASPCTYQITAVRSTARHRRERWREREHGGVTIRLNSA